MTTAKKPTTVYGGPYAQESDAITLESTKQKPNYTELISGWKTVSQGALDFIASLKSPVEPEDGPFVKNVILEEEKVEETTEVKVEGQTEVNLDEL